jgi:hypothetical protein
MKHIIILFTFITVLASCSKQCEPMVFLDQSIKTDAIELTQNKVEINTFILAKEYYIMDDSVLIVFNDTHHCICFFEFYNINNGSLLKRYLYRGNGHGELVNVIAYYNDGYLYVDGFMNSIYAMIDCRKLLHDPLYAPEFKKYSIFSQFLLPYDEETFIYENPYCFSEPSINVKQDVPRLVLSNTELSKGKYDTFNVTGGIIMQNKSADRIVYASKNYPIIEIYDTKLKLIKTIKGPDDLDIKYHISEKNNEIIFKGVIPNTYARYAYNKSNFYLVYKGVLSNDLGHNPDSWIFKFKWDGDFIDSYYFKGNIDCISIGSNDNCLFATTSDSSGELSLIKLFLKK